MRSAALQAPATQFARAKLVFRLINHKDHSAKPCSQTEIPAETDKPGRDPRNLS
jgi:hypothetical protein